jgi:AcrR family transcriptional regulator
VTQEQSGSSRHRDVDVTVASQRRRQIIDAARECITEEGVEKLTLRKVGDRAGVSHATIAYYFHSRRELIDSALVEMSADFLTGLQHRRRTNGTRDLYDLLVDFLDPENVSARYIVQMIDAGLHDPELRRIHDDFIRYGRESIEHSIAAGMARSELRDDLDAPAAAAMFHSLLVWWQGEVAAGTATAAQAREIAGLALTLLRQPGAVVSAVSTTEDTADTEALTTVETVEKALATDPRLPAKSAETLAAVFRSLYELAAESPSS